MVSSRCAQLAVLGSIALAGAPAPASADGLPLPVESSENGVLSPDGKARYLTAFAEGRTAVIAQDPSSGGVRASALLKGRFSAPLVAYDGTAGGVSPDGRTLVLIRPRARFPRADTALAIMDAKPRPRLRRVLRLHGDFSFDALSPDGRSLFLINYISRRDPTKYRVRVYDLAHDRLIAAPVVDPRESPDEMNGLPITRVSSADGRWAYTLYAGSSGQPFIHALDTRDRRAVCIDLKGRAFAGDPYGLRLAIPSGSGRLDVLARGGRVATVDVASFRVRLTPARPAARAPAASEATEPGNGPLAAVIAAIGVLLVAISTLALSRRRRRARAARPGEKPICSVTRAAAAGEPAAAPAGPMPDTEMPRAGARPYAGSAPPAGCHRSR